jgi:recombinase
MAFASERWAENKTIVAASRSRRERRNCELVAFAMENLFPASAEFRFRDEAVPVGHGRHAGGSAYGYRAVPGKAGELEIVEEEAAIVRRIFATDTAGRTPRDIAHDLNIENLRPPRGRRPN